MTSEHLLPGDPAAYEAIGTVGAFTIALIAFLGSLRDRRREQASRVSAWFQIRPESPKEIALMLLNASNQPVHNLFVTPTGRRRDDAEPLMPAILPPGTQVIPSAPEIVGAYNMPHPADLVFTDSLGRDWHRLGISHRLRRCRIWHRHPWTAARRSSRG